MAEDRASRIRRIVKVQEQLHRAEEWRLAEIEQRLSSVETDQRELIEALNGESGLEGLFLDTTARRIRSLDDTARKTETERMIQAGRVLQTGARLKAAEHLMEKADMEAERHAEQQELREALERLAAQAPGKIKGG